MAANPRASFRGEHYWAKPVPGFGDPQAKVLLFGLAPAAHGANRTGRMFTGDRSGDFLYAALYATGFANQPTATGRADGLRLNGLYITAAVRCPPPQNRPTREERERCLPWTAAELALLENLKVVVCLGGFAWKACFALLAREGNRPPRVPFGHGVEVSVPPLTLLASYHPSQQNTFTGRLTAPMLEAVLLRARQLAGYDQKR